jgi:chromosome segregation ATPase
MSTPSDNAVTASGPSGGDRGPTPFWVWLLVLALGALAVYGGYAALSNYQLYYDTETSRQALARDKGRLEANVADLEQQLELADKGKGETENALKQSRADTETAHAQITDLQGQISAHQATVKTMETARAAAEDEAKQAVDAKAALAKEVEGLKSRLHEIQAKLDQTLSDLTRAKQQSQNNNSPTPAP